ncbi:unnamed protein product [Gongylonema pulchrum]|uniref:Transposase n=1 Tax=Gongylonema pulchrum TaxID=637853 RepID=A0A183D0C1_9BILA|nr:unnamed protein product [Gongylonema pulchrum]
MFRAVEFLRCERQSTCCPGFFGFLRKDGLRLLCYEGRLWQIRGGGRKPNLAFLIENAPLFISELLH